MQEEVWKDIIGYEGLYQVNNYGYIKKLSYEYVDSHGTGRHRVFPEKFVTIQLSKNGYCVVDLYKNCERKRYYVHRLVAEAFIPNTKNLPCINHKDEIKTNNNVTNLEWCDWSYNNSYGTNRVRMVETRRKNNTYNVSNETRKKLSANNSRYWLGKKRSDEDRYKMSFGKLKNKYKNICDVDK